MRHILVPVLALFASMTILLLGGGLMGTLLSVRLSFEAIDPQIKGVVLSAYYIGLVAGSLLADRIIRSVGHIRAFAVFASVCAAAVLLQGLYVLPLSWLLLRVVIGFASAGTYMVVESWLNAHAGAEHRGRVFSIYQVVSYMALGAGQFLLYLGDPAGAELFMIVGALYALGLIPVALSRLGNPPEPTTHTPMALRRTLARSPLAAWTCIASGLMGGAIYTLTPAVGLRWGLEVGGVSFMMASLILGGVLLQWPIGYLSDRYGRRGLIVAVALATAVVSALLAIVAQDMPFPVLLVTVMAFGGLSFTFYPLAVSQANDAMGPSGDFVAVAAALLFLWGTSAAAGPVVAGAMISVLGAPGLFFWMGGIALVTAIAAVLMRSQEVPARAAYQILTRTTAVIEEMDPRVREVEESAAGSNLDVPDTDDSRDDG